MKSLAAACLLALTISSLRATSLALVLDNQLLASPAEVGALGSQLTSTSQGEIYASWIEEETVSETKTLRVARFDGRQHRWIDSQIVARGHDLVASGSNTPQLAAGGGEGGKELTALWFLENEEEPAASGMRGDCRAVWSVSRDEGKTWTAPL